MVAFIVIKINKIDGNIDKNIFEFNAKTKQIDHELHRMKSKSLDMADMNIKIRRKSENLENELLIIKQKLLSERSNIARLNDKIETIKKL